MWRKTAVVAVLAGAIVLALSPAPLLAASGQPSISASTGAGCWGDEVLCQALADLAELQGSVDELVSDAGIANSLDVKVDAATAAALALRITSALDQLDAFGNEVAGLENAGQLSAPVANVLKTKHDTAKNSISNIRA